ncbi:MAG: hypothetical protein EAZ85_03090 [Bacteroidetes bacterium]|nr:MAG: hypothetical protein EAZ85_03090 [Bacteroidota bacterium]
MNDFFISLYEVFIGSYKYGRDFKKFFVFVAYINILSSLLLPTVYYLVLNKLSTTKYATIIWWFFILLLNIIISALVVIIFANNYYIRNANAVDYNTYAWYLVIINIFYSSILYFLVSITLKNLGKNHASKIPF